MTAWNPAQLTTIGGADEVELASRRPDGTLRAFVTMWAVAVGDNLYVRSAGGANRPWYRHAVASSVGRVRADGIEADVTFATADGADHAAIDDAYHAKYDRYGARIVASVVGSTARTVTIRLTPTARAQERNTP